MYVKADRLTRMGWKAAYTDKVSLLETLPGMVDAAVEDMGWTAPEGEAVGAASA